MVFVHTTRLAHTVPVSVVPQQFNHRPNVTLKRASYILALDTDTGMESVSLVGCTISVLVHITRLTDTITVSRIQI